MRRHETSETRALARIRDRLERALVELAISYTGEGRRNLFSSLLSAYRDACRFEYRETELYE